MTFMIITRIKLLLSIFGELIIKCFFITAPFFFKTSLQVILQIFPVIAFQKLLIHTVLHNKLLIGGNGLNMSVMITGHYYV